MFYGNLQSAYFSFYNQAFRGFFIDPIRFLNNVVSVFFILVFREIVEKLGSVLLFYKFFNKIIPCDITAVIGMIIFVSSLTIATDCIKV